MARIIGTGSFMPRSVISNIDMEKYVETNDEWIRTRTGISQRHISMEDENTGDLGYGAALEALKDAGISPMDLDYIIVATTTPHSFVPTTSCYIQGKLGAMNAACFDINAACSGFIYGVEIAESLLEKKDKEYVLVIGAEVLSKIVDFNDRSTCVLFGDGAGAAVLKKGEGIKGIVTGADGTKGAVLNTGDFKVRNMLTGPNESDNMLSMEGKEVYKFAVQILPQAIRSSLEKSEMNVEDLDYIIPHQANIRIIEAAAKRLSLPMDKFYVNIQNTGNTSSASIAIALDEMNKKGLLKNGDKISMVGFGGGLTYGALTMVWNK
ncbi:MAG: beta-ketoacyl-ACP synthase III [Clostridiaceae bacterium]